MWNHRYWHDLLRQVELPEGTTYAELGQVVARIAANSSREMRQSMRDDQIKNAIKFWHLDHAWVDAWIQQYGIMRDRDFDDAQAMLHWLRGGAELPSADAKFSDAPAEPPPSGTVPQARTILGIAAAS